MKIIGPRILPWGTPDVTVSVVDMKLLNFVCCVLLVKYDLHHVAEFFPKKSVTSF
jgi:hypothetical protein